MRNSGHVEQVVFVALLDPLGICREHVKSRHVDEALRPVLPKAEGTPLEQAALEGLTQRMYVPLSLWLEVVSRSHAQHSLQPLL